MASAKSGTKVSSVKPAAVKEVHDADTSDPVKMAQVKAEQKSTQSGKYGAVKHTPHKPEEEEGEEEEKKSWIEIELLDEEDKPVPGEAYRITLPDDSVVEGTLDGKGFARVDGIEPGSCKITFPNLDKEAWEKA